MRRWFCLLLALAGCSGGGGDDTVVFDAAIDSSPSIDAQHTCVTASLPIVVDNQAGFGTGVDHLDPDAVVMVGELGTPEIHLRIELLRDYGIFTDGVVTGTFPIQDSKLNNETCGLCVHVINEPADEDRQEYFATEGSVTISGFATNITGSFTDLHFEEVEIDPTTMHSMPVPDGCTASMTGTGTFDVPVTWQ